MRQAAIPLLVLMGLGLMACGGAQKGFAVDWNDHRTVRTCAAQASGYSGPGDPICTGYARKDDVVGAVTDVHYVTVQIERVYFRNLPEWTQNSELAVSVSIKGLLPDNQEYREVLEIVNVKKHSFLQIQNKSLNFPVRYRNRTISIGFSIVELDNSEEARRWFNKGKDVMGALRGTAWLAGAFGTGLFYELAKEVADRVFEYANADDHVFSMKQVDFLPALSVTGLQEQLLLTEGRYIVVAVPPASAYESLRAVMTDFPERLDGGFLQNNAYYEGGYLKLKGGNSEYTFTPYIALNVVMGKRYFDENPIVENIKEANRLMQFGKLEEAAAMLNAAEAQFTIPTTVSPKALMQEAGVIPPGKKGLLDVSTKDIIGGAVSIVRGKDPKRVLHSRLGQMGLLGEFASRLLGGKPAEKPKPAPAAPKMGVSGVKVERLYTDVEYTFFADWLIAMRAKLELLKAKDASREQTTKVLRLFRRAISNSKDLPRSPAECQVYRTSLTELWARLVESYGITEDDEISDGNRMALVTKLGKRGKLGEQTAEEAFEFLQQQREFLVGTNKRCLPRGLRAY